MRDVHITSHMGCYDMRGCSLRTSSSIGIVSGVASGTLTGSGGYERIWKDFKAITQKKEVLSQN